MITEQFIMTAIWISTALGGILTMVHCMLKGETARLSSIAEDRLKMQALAAQYRKEDKGPIMGKCSYCDAPCVDKLKYCALCLDEQKRTRENVTDFDAYMMCPHCGLDDYHDLREARHRPMIPPTELKERFAAWHKTDQAMHRGYIEYVHANADTLIEAFGFREPVRVIMNDAAAEAHAARIKPISVSMDNPRHSKYDPIEATVIRTCKGCMKEWAQK